MLVAAQNSYLCNAGLVPWPGWTFAEWDTYENPSLQWWFGQAVDNCSYYPGLYVSMPTDNPFQAGNYGAYEITAPAGAYISDAGWAGTEHIPLASALLMGLYEPAQGVFESGVSTFNGSSWASGNPVDYQQELMNQLVAVCTSVCPAPAVGGNEAMIGIQATVNVYTSLQRAQVGTESASVLLGDVNPPTVSGLPASTTGWVNDNDKSYPGTVTFQASGLGVQSITYPGSGLTQTTVANTGCGDPYTDPCVTLPIPENYSFTLPEGVTDVTASATDPTGTTTTETSVMKIDRTAPTVNMDGDLAGADGEPLSGSSYDLNIDATDEGPDGAQTSGVQKIVIKVDPDSSGNSPYPVITQTNTGCSPSGCPQEMDYTWTMETSTYGDGQHTVEIDTTDAAGNTDTETVPVTLVHINQLPSQTVSLPIQGSPQITGPAGSQFGASVANVGDVTGSGYDDLLVGAPDASCDGRSDVGAAYLILGSANTAPIDVSVPDPRVIRFCGASTGDLTGTAVASGGDVNGDGYPDLLIGAPGSGLLGLLPQGRVYVIFGGPNLQSMDLSNFANETQTNAPGTGFLIKGPALSTNINVGLGHPAPVAFGASLGNQNVGDYSTNSDFNGDGLDDIVIGDSGDSSSLRLGAGTVWLIYGKTDDGTIDLSATGGAYTGREPALPVREHRSQDLRRRRTRRSRTGDRVARLRRRQRERIARHHRPRPTESAGGQPAGPVRRRIRHLRRKLQW